MSNHGAQFDQRLAADAAQTFVDGAFGEVIYRYPLNDTDNPEILEAVVDRNDLSGTNEEPGDGAVIDSKEGERERKTYKLELLATVTVDDRDTFWIPPSPVHTEAALIASGVLWKCRRRLGEDAGMRGYRLVRPEPKHTRFPNLRKS
jgi:hypothetical protein